MARKHKSFTIAAIAGLCVVLNVFISYGASVTIKGSGDEITDILSFSDGLLMVGAAHKGHRNFVVELVSADGGKREMLVNAIGDYQGVRLISIPAGRYRFQVQSDRAWVLMHEQPDPQRPGTKLPISHSHIGDAPLGPFIFNQGLLLASFTHEGTRNFAVTLFAAGGSSVALLVNKIGTYKGTVTASIPEPGQYWLAVQASGAWSVELTMDE